MEAGEEVAIKPVLSETGVEAYIILEQLKKARIKGPFLINSFC